MLAARRRAFPGVRGPRTRPEPAHHHKVEPSPLGARGGWDGCGDSVVSRMSSTATHTGEFQGIPPTGKRIAVTGIWLDRLAGGKLVERWGVVDALGVL